MHIAPHQAYHTILVLDRGSICGWYAKLTLVPGIPTLYLRGTYTEPGIEIINLDLNYYLISSYIQGCLRLYQEEVLKILY